MLDGGDRDLGSLTKSMQAPQPIVCGCACPWSWKVNPGQRMLLLTPTIAGSFHAAKIQESLRHEAKLWTV